MFRFRNAVLLAVVALAALLAVNATQIMQRPETYKQAPKKAAMGNATPKVVTKRATGKTNSAYFTNWCDHFWYLAVES